MTSQQSVWCAPYREYDLGLVGGATRVEMFLVGSSRTLLTRFLTRFAAKREQSRYSQVHETDKGANRRRIRSEPPLSSRFYISSASKLESDGGSDGSHPNRRGPEKSAGSYNLQELLDRIARAQLQKDEQLVENRVKLKTKRPKFRRTSLLSIDELVNFLREQKAHDICVLKIPPEREYVEYFVVCSGLGTRHIRVMADCLVAEVSEN